ncbi:MAG: mechanosensitive ion channel family protein [Gammaproteobacteria bacterium]|nr:mechanosensitive ion channel family protein [Gammaproteobacteria bacterium]
MLYDAHELYNHFTHPDKLLNGIYAISLIVMGFFIAKRISYFVEIALTNHVSRHHILVIKRLFFYLIFTIFSVSGLQHLGFKLNFLLGAAGIFTVAIGFASQTAISNLISGIFLLFERPCKVGDTIEIKKVTGVVESIDMLSTKLKTADNKLVRIPNEVMIKSQMTNLSYFATRRIDIHIAVPYDCDIAKVKAIFLTIAENCDQVLDDPAPNVVVNGFVGGAIDLKFMAWVNATDLPTTHHYLQEKMNQQFDREKITHV